VIIPPFLNRTLTSSTPHYSFKKSFDIISEGVISGIWQAVVDNPVTWIRIAEITIFECEQMYSRLRKALQNCPKPS